MELKSGHRMSCAMDTTSLKTLLQQVRSGDVGIEAALEALAVLPYEDLGFARLDHHRPVRTGFPEIVFGQGKPPAQLATIVERLAQRNSVVLCTRVAEEAVPVVQRAVPHAVYVPAARALVVRRPGQSLESGQQAQRAPGDGSYTGVAVVSAGTTDEPVAEEAALTAEVMGHAVDRIYDVGVAGLHRILGALDRVRAANVVVVVAGMDGALPSVVTGLVAVPVIAVPTSIGYGASFGGITALLGMLNTCALGAAVVNIDNGVAAGVMAAMINRQTHCGLLGSDNPRPLTTTNAANGRAD